MYNVNPMIIIDYSWSTIVCCICFRIPHFSTTWQWVVKPSSSLWTGSLLWNVMFSLLWRSHLDHSMIHSALFNLLKNSGGISFSLSFTLSHTPTPTQMDDDVVEESDIQFRDRIHYYPPVTDPSIRFSQDELLCNAISLEINSVV